MSAICGAHVPNTPIMRLRGRADGAAGITEVVAEVLAENAAMLRLLGSTFPDLLVEHDGPELTCTAGLGDCALAAA
jgi:hypothetical protein